MSPIHKPHPQSISKRGRRKRGEGKGGGRDRPGEEVPKVVEFAVLFVFDVDDSPTVLPTSNGFTVDDDVAFGTDDREWDHVLRPIPSISEGCEWGRGWGRGDELGWLR